MAQETSWKELWSPQPSPLCGPNCTSQSQRAEVPTSGTAEGLAQIWCYSDYSENGSKSSRGVFPFRTVRVAADCQYRSQSRCDLQYIPVADDRCAVLMLPGSPSFPQRQIWIHVADLDPCDIGMLMAGARNRALGLASTAQSQKR